MNLSFRKVFGDTQSDKEILRRVLEEEKPDQSLKNVRWDDQSY